MERESWQPIKPSFSKAPPKELVKKIFHYLLLLFLAVFIFFAVRIIQNRYFTKEIPEDPEELVETTTESDLSESDSAEIETEETDLETEDEDEKDTEDIDTQEVVEEKPKESFLSISEKDCKNRCTDYRDKKLKYCKQFCGLEDLSKNSEDACSQKDDLEADYCYKDLAIEKKDFQLCEKINDKNIYKTCQNRITEDILDEQQDLNEL